MGETQRRRGGAADALVLAAMAEVPRGRFVDEFLLELAYTDGALGIGGGQTISQPYMVARMSESLELGAGVAAPPEGRPRGVGIGPRPGYPAARPARRGG